MLLQVRDLSVCYGPVTAVAGRQSGEFDFEDENAIARALLQATNGLLPYSLSTTELGERREVEKRAAAVADLVMRGLLNRNRTTV